MAVETSPNAPSKDKAGLSKRALKRNAKKEPTIVAEPVPEAPEPSDKLIEFVQKRVRNLQKRKAKLDKYQTIAESADNTLNADQLAALADRESVEAPLKELGEVLTLYKEQLTEKETEIRRQKAEYEAQLKKQTREAKQAAKVEARKAIELTLGFLRAASIKRAINASVAAGSTELSPVPAEETTAFESLLQKLYAADDDSLKFVDLLVAGADVAVEENAATYKLIKSMSEMSVSELYDASKRPEPLVKVTTNGHVDPVNDINGSSLQISFLQEEVVESDGDDAESEATTVNEPGTAEATPEPVGEEQQQQQAGEKKKFKRWRSKKNKKKQTTDAAVSATTA